MSHFCNSSYRLFCQTQEKLYVGFAVCQLPLHFQKLHAGVELTYDWPWGFLKVMGHRDKFVVGLVDLRMMAILSPVRIIEKI
jgi:hypothetical protein